MNNTALDFGILGGMSLIVYIMHQIMIHSNIPVLMGTDMSRARVTIPKPFGNLSHVEAGEVSAGGADVTSESIGE